VATSLRDPLAGRLRLGVIPTLAPFLLPLVFAPLRAALPGLEVEPWEDQTAALLRRLRGHELDAAVLATDAGEPDLASLVLFAEPFLAALPPEHRLAGQALVEEAALAADILVLADGHCLRDQVLAACGHGGAMGGAMRATSLMTLINMVAAGYGTTLIPGLAAGAARGGGGGGRGDRAAVARVRGGGGLSKRLLFVNKKKQKNFIRSLSGAPPSNG
jgi:LysR family hydrogen peroxide-inducible transcriptional activator